MDPNVAWARFLRSVATAANQLAVDLTEASTQPDGVATATTASPETLVRGERQRAIVALPGLRNDEGMKTAEIAHASGNPDVPNVYLAMRALEKRGLVELVPNREPQRWRLVAHFRQPPAT